MAERQSWPKRLAKVFLGDYQIFRIYELDLQDPQHLDRSTAHITGCDFQLLTNEQLEASNNSEIRSRTAAYCGTDSFAFGLLVDDEIICVQWYWFGERYLKRNFWPLKETQAKSVELFTLPGHRGKGLATALKLYSAVGMREKGFTRLFSRIWHSHRESRRVSENAGWKNIAIVLEFKPPFLRRRLRWVRKP